MKIFIPQTFPKLILFLSLISCFSSSSTSSNSASHLQDYPLKTLVLAKDKEVKVYVAKGYERQKLGLSHIQDKDFSQTEAMLFPADDMKLRQFWMPNTHFDLDIFFLNEDMFVLDIHRNVKHFKGSGSREVVPLSKEVFCQHVLELRSDSPLAKMIKRGNFLKFK